MNVIANPAQQQFDEAEAVLQRLQHRTDLMLQEHMYVAWLRKIHALSQLGRNAEEVAEADALIAHCGGDAAHTGGLRACCIAEALTRKGLALRKMGDADAELAAYAEVESRFDNATTPELRLWLARAGFERNVQRAGLGGTFSKVDTVRDCAALAVRFGADELLATRVIAVRARALQAQLMDELAYRDPAREIYRELSDAFGRAQEPELRYQAAQAVFNLAQSLVQEGDAQNGHAGQTEIIKLYELLLAQYGEEQSAEMRALLAVTAFKRADMLDDEGEQDLALQACDELLGAHAGETQAEVVEQGCRALLLKAHVLHNLYDDAAQDTVTQALAAYVAVIDLHGQRTEPAISLQLARAYYGRVVLADTPDAECAACDLMISALTPAGKHTAGPDLDPWLARAWLVKGLALSRANLQEAALETLDGLLTRFDASTDSSVALRVARARMARALVLGELGRGAEAQATYLALADHVSSYVIESRNAGRDVPDELRAEAAAALRLLATALGSPAQAEAETVDATGTVRAAPDTRAGVVRRLLADYGTDVAAEVREPAALAAYDWAVGLRESEDFESALAAYDLLLHHFVNDSAEAVRHTVASALLNKGFLLLMLMDRPQDALAVYDDIMHRYKNATSADLRDTLAKAVASRYTCLNKLNKTSAADFGGDYADLEIATRDAVYDTITRGRALADDGKPREAIRLFDEVLAAHVESSHPELRRQCARAMLNKAYQLVAHLGEYAVAVACAEEMEARYGLELSIEMQEKVALCLLYKTTALKKLGRHDEVRRVYDTIIACWDDSNVLALRERVAEALCHKAQMLLQGDIDEALRTYDNAIERTADAKQPELHRWAALALLSKAGALDTRGERAGACMLYRHMICLFDASEDATVRGHLLDARERLATAEGQLGHRETQIAVLEETLTRFSDLMPMAQRLRIRLDLAGLRPQWRQRALQLLCRVVRGQR